jgi:hypothetical protein
MENVLYQLVRLKLLEIVSKVTSAYANNWLASRWW